MNQIDQLLRALNPEIIFEDAVQPVVTKTQFFVHIDKAELTIVAVAPNEPADDNLFSLKIDYDQAIKFMTGTDSPTNWSVELKDGNYTIIKNSELRNRNSRVDVISILDLPWDEVIENPDIQIIVDRQQSQAEIYYNGARLPNWRAGARFYFTREADPSYLKCSFSLDVNILDTLKKVNDSDEWPNPIILPLNDVDDLSVFTVKSDLKISLSRKNETSSNGI